MTFSRKMCLTITLKVTKNQGFTLSLEGTFFEKPKRKVGGGGQTDTPPAVLGLNTRITPILCHTVLKYNGKINELI